MDVTFIHELLHSEHKLINLNEPEWMRYFHLLSQYPRFTTPSPISSPDGLNFTSNKFLEMPFYDKQFLDKNTIWTQPLFPLKYLNFSSQSGDNNYFPHCLSYEALLKRGQIESTTTGKSKEARWKAIQRRKQDNERKRKPSWQYTDLRAVFNQR